MDLKLRGNTLITGTLAKPFFSCVFICLFIRQNGSVNQPPRYPNPKVSLDTTITTTVIKEFQGNKNQFLRFALGQMLAYIISLMHNLQCYMLNSKQYVSICYCSSYFNKHMRKLKFKNTQLVTDGSKNLSLGPSH